MVLQWGAAGRRGAPHHSSSVQTNQIFKRSLFTLRRRSHPPSCGGTLSSSSPVCLTAKQGKPPYVHSRSAATQYRKCSTYAFWARRPRWRSANVTDLRNVPIDPHDDSYYPGDIIFPPPLYYLLSLCRTSDSWSFTHVHRNNHHQQTYIEPSPRHPLAHCQT